MAELLVLNPRNYMRLFTEFGLVEDLDEAGETIHKIIGVLHEAEEQIRIKKAIRTRESQR